MKLEKVDDKTAYENLLVKYAELENKIADIKANCDLAIEGRDIKIKELELELTVEKDLHREETNLHLHAEDYIKSLEQKLEQTEKDLADYQFNYPKIKELEKENAELKKINSETLTQLNLDNGELIIENEKLRKENAGLKAGRIQWHKVADGDLPKGDEYGKNSIHRNIYLKDRYGNLYTGNYFPKDETHTEDCFAVEVLEWGFQGSQFCKKEQISEWCELPTFDKE